MKRIIFLAVALLATSCQDIEVLESAPTINLGEKPSGTQIVSVASKGSSADVTLQLKAGAKYSLQVYSFDNLEPVKTIKITAEKDLVKATYDFSELTNGIYDLVLTDIEGNTIREPLFINR